MALADDLEEAQNIATEQNKEPITYKGTIASVTPLTVILDGSGVAIPCLAFSGVTVKESRRVGLIKIGSDFVVIGAFGTQALTSLTLDDDLYVGDDLTVRGDIFWGASGTGFATALEASLAGPISNLNNSFVYTGLSLAFVAPPSGKVRIAWGGKIKGAVLNSFCWIGYELRDGATIGGGSVVSGHSAATARSIVLRAANTFQEMAAGRSKLATGLTPNGDYHIRIMHASSDTGGTNESADMDVSVTMEI